MRNAAFSLGARPLALLAAGVALVAAAATGEARAATAGSAFVASAVANVAAATRCARTAIPAFATAQTVGTAALITRPRERKLSALERMRAQQAAPATTLSLAQSGAIANRPSYMPEIAARAAAATAEPVEAEPAPSIVPAARFGITCANPFDAAARPGLAQSRFDFLQSRILPVSTTSFDSAWHRVGETPAGRGVVHAALVKAETGEGTLEDRIADVNRWVNRHVTYVSDRKLYGKADYWASADETLRHGKGDCEDYAIAKMQILAAMGIAREDMFLTLARDLVRRDDHAVLIVKVGGRSILLDNASDTLLDGEAANDYRPILSFSADRRYLHGY